MSCSSQKQPENLERPSGILRHINVESLFNLPLYEHHLVIDTRSADVYDQGHIVSAVSYPSLDLSCSDLEREKTLVKFIKSYVKEYFRPENPSPVVVYGDSTPECVAHIDWLASKLEQLQKDRKILAKVDKDPSEDISEREFDDAVEDKPFDYFQHFCHTIADRAKEIWILDDGYEAFKQEYPFLCGHVDWNALFPLPHQVNHNLFLGTRVFPLKKDCLKKLGITHVILSQRQKINWRELDGISVLRCAVKDENDQAMLPCWKACYQFITEALSGTHSGDQPTTDGQDSTVDLNSDSRDVNDGKTTKDNDETELLSNMADLKISTLSHQQPSPDAMDLGGEGRNAASNVSSATTTLEQEEGESTDTNSASASESVHGVRILVLLHGRSRSSSVILAYLIKSRRMGFGQAWTFLCSKCWHIIDRSLVYVDQLKLWEQTELAAIEEF